MRKSFAVMTAAAAMAMFATVPAMAQSNGGMAGSPASPQNGGAMSGGSMSGGAMSGSTTPSGQMSNGGMSDATTSGNMSSKGEMANKPMKSKKMHHKKTMRKAATPASGMTPNR